MRDRKEYNEQLDDFSRLVRQKLEGHRIPVDADSWTEIEQRLKPQKRLGQRLWWMAGAAAAVAVLVSVYLFRPQDNIDKQIATVGQTSSIDQELSVITEKKHDQAEEPAYPAPVKKKPLPQSVGSPAQQTKSVVTSRGVVNTVADIEKTLSTDSVAQEIEKKLSELIADAGSDVETSDSVPAKSDVKRKEEPKVWLAEKKNKKEKDWLLAASFSSNGSVSNNNVGDRMMYYNYPGPLKGEMTNDISLFAAKDPYTLGNAEHSLPLSFGISVRKNLSDRFGIETGLVYTYLSSRFNSASSAGDAMEAKQELHYLGIPLNAVVYLWDNSNWNIYMSAGGMGEKGLSRSYTYSKRNANGSIKEGIDGIQWSLNAAVGISYRIYQDWGIYFEPKYSYFFDNNQPASIRTDKHSFFGFNAGFRFEF